MVVDETVRCLCTRRVEEGEMVCCDVCQRWSHLRCIGMKEGVEMIEGKELCATSVCRHVCWHYEKKWGR